MYSKPLDLEEALLVLKNSNPKVIAGGTDFYPSLKPGFCLHHCTLTVPSGCSEASRVRAHPPVPAVHPL